jgi:hypothetical protein
VSRSALACRGCGRVLAHRHHTGRLHPTPGVVVYMDPKGRFGPYARLVCPGCNRHRDWRDGALVVRAQ